MALRRASSLERFGLTCLQRRTTMFTSLRTSILFALFSLPFISRSQLVVDTTLAPADLVEQFLAGEGVQVFNVTFNGLPGDQLHEQIGGFNGTLSNIGMDAGVIMATGSIDGALGPNDYGSSSSGGGNFGQGDPDLMVISNTDMNDAAVLEFDLIASQEYIGFRFVFASEEYPEYVCNTVNDAFGFFLSGPGISGVFLNEAVNIALVPNTQVPISINTINPGVVGTNGYAANCDVLDPNWAMNAVYHLSNGTGEEAPWNEDTTVVQYDGFTTVIWVTHAVTPGEMYHLKLAIADGDDMAFDSAVFLESGSFMSAQFPLGVTSPTPLEPLARFIDGELVLDLPERVRSGLPVVLLDASGREVLRAAVRGSTLRLPASQCAAGPYVLHIPGSGCAPVRVLKP